MKAFLVYWFFGCFIMSAALADLVIKCPRDAGQLLSPSYDILIGVAVWPALVLTAINLSLREVKPSLIRRECKVAP